MTPQEYCQQKVRQSHSSFRMAFIFFTPRQQRAINAIYTFCREVDDIADKINESSVAALKLNWWRTEINALYYGTASHPVTLELQQLLPDFSFKKEHFLLLLDGVSSDLTKQRFENFSALEHYCYQVAGSVGLLILPICGYQKNNYTRLEQFAINMGKALQLVNIIRDIVPDNTQGRCYLPAELLSAYHLDEAHILDTNRHKDFSALCNNLAERAKYFHQQAMYHLPAEERYHQCVPLILGKIYLTLLDKMQKANFVPGDHKRYRLHPLYQFWIAYTTRRQEYRMEQHRIHQLSEAN